MMSEALARGFEYQAGEKGLDFGDRGLRGASGGDWRVGTRFALFAGCGASQVGSEFGGEGSCGRDEGARAVQVVGLPGHASDGPTSGRVPQDRHCRMPLRGTSCHLAQWPPPGRYQMPASYIDTNIDVRRPDGRGRRGFYAEFPDTPKLLSACAPTPPPLRSFSLTTTGARCVGPPVEYNSRFRCGVAPRAQVNRRGPHTPVCR